MKLFLLSIFALILASQVAVSAPSSKPTVVVYEAALKIQGHQPGELFDSLMELADLMGVEIDIQSDVSDSGGYWESAEFRVEGSPANVAAFKREYHHLRSEYLGQ
jgi:hypothetical protein